jgi:hypothetical protein
VSLEPAAFTENGESQKEIEILQAQLERVESQLEKAREAAVLDRQACRTAQTDLYKVRILNLFLITASQPRPEIKSDCWFELHNFDCFIAITTKRKSCLLYPII